MTDNRPVSYVGVPVLTLAAALVAFGGYAWQCWILGSYADFSVGPLAWLGANVPPLSLADEPWRLISSMFLHGSLDHLMSNVVVLLIVGAMLEIRVGRWRWLCVFLGGGLAASFVSACVHYDVVLTNLFGVSRQQLYVSVGMFRAVMSLSAATVVYALLQLGQDSDDAQAGALLRTALIITGLNLVYGFFQDGIDNATHLTGAVFGVLSGIVLFMPHGLVGGWKRYGLGALVVFIMVIAAGRFYALLPQASRRADLTARAVQLIDEVAQTRAIASARAAEQDQRLEYVDDAKGQIVSVPGVVRIEPSGDRNRVYLAANGDQSRLLEYDLAKQQIRRTIATGDYVDGKFWGCPFPQCSGVGVTDLVVDEAAGKLYASNFVQGAVSRVDMASGAIDYTTTTGSFPVRLVLDQGRLYAYDTADNTLAIVDTSRGALLNTVAMPGNGESRDSVYTWPNGRLLVVSKDEASLIVRTPERRAVVFRIASRQTRYLPPKNIEDVGRDASGRIWLLSDDHIYYGSAEQPAYAVDLAQPSNDEYRGRASARARINRSFIDADGGHPLVLALEHGAVVGRSAATGDVRRRWPIADAETNIFALQILDSDRFYLWGRSSTQILEAQRSQAP